MRAQVYWEGYYDFEPTESMILETEMQEQVRYWNIQLGDAIFNTVEYLYCQSSLNGAQARIDSDGKFRAVIALEDPRIANWLDPQQRRLGHLVGRWYESSSQPMPTLRRVKASEVRDHLPTDTALGSPEERQESIMAQVRGSQIRRRW